MDPRPQMDPSICTPDRLRPPVLPVKQRRSQYSTSSSVDVECEGGVCGPLGTPSAGVAVNVDVFAEPTDCHAAKCPIHQRYDPPPSHQERFYSDTNCPPPVPQKRLVRALSLPQGYLYPPSPSLSPNLSPGLHSSLSPLPYGHRNYDNPLYMMTSVPVADPGNLAESERERRPVQQRSPVQLPPLSKLSFDTPDPHLPHYFCGFADQGCVSRCLQQRHLLFLKSVAEGLEAGQLLEGGSRQGDSALQPRDFLLCGNDPPLQIGGALYYPVQSPRFPGRLLAAKITSEVAPAPPDTSRPPHVNIQQLVAFFPPCPVLENDLSPSLVRGPTVAPESVRTAPWPQEGSIVPERSRADPSVGQEGRPTVVSLLQRGYGVAMERDLPQATLEDFVEEGRSYRSVEEVVRYERRLCVLVLQLATGIQHLSRYAACICVQLKPRDVFLVWPRREGEGETKGEEVEEERAGEISEAGERSDLQRSGVGAAHGRSDGNEEMGVQKEGVQILWRKWGTPRVVLDHHTALSPEVPPPPPLQAQFGAIVQYCLSLRRSALSATQGPGTSPPDSPYGPGLLGLADWLQNEGSGLQIADVVGVLQALLWGPRVGLFRLNPAGPGSSVVDRWLAVKRGLLVLKLAEKGLDQGQSGVDWEDLLCLQYLSLTDPGSVVRSTARLGLHNPAD